MKFVAYDTTDTGTVPHVTLITTSRATAERRAKAFGENVGVALVLNSEISAAGLGEGDYFDGPIRRRGKRCYYGFRRAKMGDAAPADSPALVEQFLAPRDEWELRMRDAGLLLYV